MSLYDLLILLAMVISDALDSVPSEPISDGLTPEGAWVLLVYTLGFTGAVTFLCACNQTKVVRGAVETYFAGIRFVTPLVMLFVILDCRDAAMITCLYGPFGGYASLPPWAYPSDPQEESFSWFFRLVALAFWVAFVVALVWLFGFTNFLKVSLFPHGSFGNFPYE